MTKPKYFEMGAGPLLVTREKRQWWSHSGRISKQPKPDQRNKEKKLKCEAEIFISFKRPSMPYPWTVQYFKVARKYSCLHSLLCTVDQITNRTILFTNIYQWELFVYHKWFLNYVKYILKSQ